MVESASAQQQPQLQKPNILFILADNTGYGDIAVYGGGELRGAPTPRIDQLAAESLRLTQFLVEPACTPSRAALMTGRYSISEHDAVLSDEMSKFTRAMTIASSSKDSPEREIRRTGVEKLRNPLSSN
jgi:hypothetical protein